jgi:hypothetical protein
MKHTLLKNTMLPVDIVLAPAWWFHNASITFDEDFFYNPAKRVEAEQKMENILYQKWGKFSLGADKDKKLPAIGAVHLAAGFLLSEMLGCKVEYKQDSPPQVICAQIDDLKVNAESAFRSRAFKKFEQLVTSLEKKYGFVTGDVNWAGILNIGLDLRGEALFMDMFDRPADVNRFFTEIAAVLEKFTSYIKGKTGSTSISVNRNIRNLGPAVLLHSECSHTMISTDDYEKFLFKYDESWSKKYRPFGIHYCGKDPHRYADIFTRLTSLDFLDVGWGGDVGQLRKQLPDTFLNIRLSPVDIIEADNTLIKQTICKLVADSANPYLTGICCINMDEKVGDDKITTMFATVEQLRKEYGKNK